MNFRIWKRARTVECGITIYPDGREAPFAHDNDISSHFDLPVFWEGVPATMHLTCWRWEGFNPVGTRMLNHPYLRAYGRVHILTHLEERFKMRVRSRDNGDVEDLIANLRLEVKPIVVRKYPTYYVDIYSVTANDLDSIAARF